MNVAWPCQAWGCTQALITVGGTDVRDRTQKLAPTRPVQLTRMGARVGGIAIAVMLFGATSALAQNCVIGAQPAIGNLGQVGSSPASVSSVVASTLTTASTAFLLQSTAFIGSPPNPAPDQQGGGVWVRSVGGGVDVKSNSSTIVTANGAVAGLPQNTPINCNQTIHENFVGVQLGTDIARLNINGWNVHVGTTAGYTETRGNVLSGAFSSFDTLSVWRKCRRRSIR